MTATALAMEIQWGDAATWAGAIFAGSAIVVALWQIARERRQRKHTEEKALAAEERAQAVKFSAWFDTSLAVSEDGGGSLVVRNASNVPIYRVVVTLVFAQGAGPRTGEAMSQLLSEGAGDMGSMQGVFVIPPGTWRVVVGAGWSGMHARPPAEVAFMDAEGMSWVRRASGSLEKLPQEPFEYFELPNQSQEAMHSESSTD
jgi:hypothetical protein